MLACQRYDLDISFHYIHFLYSENAIQIWSLVSKKYSLLVLSSALFIFLPIIGSLNEDLFLSYSTINILVTQCGWSSKKVYKAIINNANIRTNFALKYGTK